MIERDGGTTGKVKADLANMVVILSCLSVSPSLFPSFPCLSMAATSNTAETPSSMTSSTISVAPAAPVSAPAQASDPAPAPAPAPAQDPHLDRSSAESSIKTPNETSVPNSDTLRNASVPIPLTEEQKERIQRNRQEALVS